MGGNEDKEDDDLGKPSDETISFLKGDYSVPYRFILTPPLAGIARRCCKTCI